jgi:hypothetical protein
MKAPVIRISIGKFDADIAETVERKLLESRAGLEGGISAMKGNLAYSSGSIAPTARCTTSVFGRLF